MPRLMAGIAVALVMVLPLETTAQEVLLQDFGSFKNIGRDSGVPLLAGSDRLRGTNDRKVGTTYVRVQARVGAFGIAERATGSP